MTAKVLAGSGESAETRKASLDAYDRLAQVTAGGGRRRRPAWQGRQPLIVPTNNPLCTRSWTQPRICRPTTSDHGRHLTPSTRPARQLEPIAFYWIGLHGGNHRRRLTARVLNADRDDSLDLAGGNRIPKRSAEAANAGTVSPLRCLGVNVDPRVLLAADDGGQQRPLFHGTDDLLVPKDGTYGGNSAAAGGGRGGGSLQSGRLSLTTKSEPRQLRPDADDQSFTCWTTGQPAGCAGGRLGARAVHDLIVAVAATEAWPNPEMLRDWTELGLPAST